MWDELAIETQVLDVAIQLVPAPLPQATALARRPAVYLIFYDGDLAWLRTPGYPVYVGSAADGAERLCRHRSNAKPVANLRRGDDLSVVIVPMPSHAASLYAERLLIDRLRPVWTEPWLGGFGSRHQGATRTSQAPAPWNLLHPGRRTGTGEPTVSVALLKRRVIAHLAATVMHGLWRS